MKREVWILGDLNLNILLRNDREITCVNRFFKEMGLTQLLNTPTRHIWGGGAVLTGLLQILTM